ncbi:uncharacterized protein OCT59_002314 [Rhizophagus irregularis]|uniref:uncharacterized protein n=1 Tax=Rhizophagus irregularis TaxID=588596 RepID=UPI00331B444C|nr:hypothetical protein OCT59_002314 [Rhizophagus irregularis]
MWILLEGLPSPLKLGADVTKYGKREIPYTSGSFDQLEALAREFFGDLEEGTFILCGKTVEWDYGSHGYGPIDYWVIFVDILLLLCEAKSQDMDQAQVDAKSEYPSK